MASLALSVFCQSRVFQNFRSGSFVVLIGEVHFFSKRFGSHKVFGLWSKAILRVKSSQVCGVVFLGKGSGQRAGYPTKRAPDAGDSGAIPGIFL
ncbi:MAG: hypothetical protein AABZ00_05870, partial [Chloroflexota bacterium]